MARKCSLTDPQTCYTQDDVNHVLDRASKLGINVIPELDLPVCVCLSVCLSVCMCVCMNQASKLGIKVIPELDLPVCVCVCVCVCVHVCMYESCAGPVVETRD